MEAESGNINSNAALPLDVAAELSFPKGGMTGRGLRREAKNGRLVIERMNGKLFTSLTAIEQMRKLCRLEAPDPISGFASRARGAGKSLPKEHGSSSMPENISPRDAFLHRVEKRKAA